MKDFGKVLFGVGVFMLVLMLGLAIKTALVYFAWNFLVVAAWGAADITVIQSLALVVFIHCLMPSPGVKERE